jgi:hypothetical protein
MLEASKPDRRELASKHVFFSALLTDLLLGILRNRFVVYSHLHLRR